MIRTLLARLFPSVLAPVIALLPVLPALAQQPGFDFETALDTLCGDSNGLISFGDHVVAFAPEGPFLGEVALLDPAGEVLGRFPYFPDALREGVFSRVRIQGPAEVRLTRPGIYTIVYLLGGEPVTRLPIRLLEHKSEDPFQPGSTYSFDGLWRTHAHLTMGRHDDKPFPELNFWVGGRDLPAGRRTDGFFVELLRGGEVVAHTKRSLGHIAPGHFKRTKLSLFHPHTERETPNARLFLLTDWLVDGSCEIRVTRASDSTKIRSFDFEVEKGAFVPLKQTALDFEPRVDRILPRVQKKNVTAFEMIETVWIRDGGNG